MASSNPAFNALDKCEDPVKITIRNHLNEIAKFLKNSKIIDHTLYNDVTNPESREIADNKAKRLYMKLLDMVEGDEDYYLEFVGFLRKNPVFEKTVAMLDEAYTGNGKSINNTILTPGMHTGGINIIPCCLTYIAWVNWKNCNMDTFCCHIIIIRVWSALDLLVSEVPTSNMDKPHSQPHP